MRREQHGIVRSSSEEFVCKGRPTVCVNVLSRLERADIRSPSWAKDKSKLPLFCIRYLTVDKPASNRNA